MSKKTKTVKVDGGYMNAFVPPNMRGRSMNYSAEQQMLGAGLMPRPILEAAYVHNGIFRTIVDVPAEEMTRAGFCIEGDDISEELQQDLQSRMEELDAMTHFATAIKWRRAFGGGLIVVGLIDGGTLEDELNEEGISEVEFMRVYDKDECVPYRYYEDSSDNRFGQVEIWQINPSFGTGQYLVHSSRVLIFDGESIPNNLRRSNQGWGASVVQTCFKEVVRLDTALKLSVELLSKMQQAVHKIPNLSQQLNEPGGEEQVTKRVNVVDTVRGIYNTVILDGEEEYEVTSLTVANVEKIVATESDYVSMTTRMPGYVLIGKTEGGLNNSNKSTQDAWKTQIEAWQIQLLKKPLDKFVSWVIRTLQGYDGGDYTLEFNPLNPLSEAEEAEIESKKQSAKKAQMDTLTGYMTAGVMDENEVREVIREEYELEGDAPEPEADPIQPITLNPGQKLVAPEPGQHNPAPVGKK